MSLKSSFFIKCLDPPLKSMIYSLSETFLLQYLASLSNYSFSYFQPTGYVSFLTLESLRTRTRTFDAPIWEHFSKMGTLKLSKILLVLKKECFYNVTVFSQSMLAVLVIVWTITYKMFELILNVNSNLNRMY